MDIPFGPWTPDQPALNNRGVVDARNVYRTATGYRPIPGPQALGAAIGQPCTAGLFYGKDADENPNLFVATNTKMWRYTNARSFEDVTPTSGLIAAQDMENLSSILDGYAYDANGAVVATPGQVLPHTCRAQDRTRSVQYADRLITTDGRNAMLSWVLGGSTKFEELSTSAPKARYIAVVRDFVVVGDVTDVLDGRVPYRLRWSGLGRPTEWDFSAETQADFQDQNQAGNIAGITGGAYGTILCERAVYIMQFVGPPYIFQFDKVQEAKGCFTPGSVVQAGDSTYYLGDDGFYSITDGRLRNIGTEKVNAWFFENVNISMLDYMSAVAGSDQQTVYWIFCGKNALQGVPNTVLIYHIALDEFSYMETVVEALGEIIQPGYTLEDLDSVAMSLDDLPASLDSRLYKGGARLFGGVSRNRVVAFQGPPLSATIETREVQLNPPGRAAVDTLSVLSEAPDNLSVQVGTRNRQGENVVWGDQQEVLDEGLFTRREEGRFHRFRVTLSGDWKSAQGVQVFANPTSVR